MSAFFVGAFGEKVVIANQGKDCHGRHGLAGGGTLRRRTRRHRLRSREAARRGPNQMTTTLTEKTFAELFTYAGGTNGSRVNAQGFIEPCATPRFDFDPITKVAKGLLIENARINQLAFSSRFENAVWAKTSVTAVPGAAQAPNGRWDACKLTLLNGGIASVGRASQTTAKAAAAITYTFSFYAKAAGSSNGWSFASGATTGERISFAFDLSALTISLFTISVFTEVSKRIVDVGGGWRRVEIVFTTDASAALTAAVYPGAAAAGTGPGDGNAGIYIWGAQLEVGAFASSYIPSWDGVTARASIGSYYDAKGILRYAAAGVARNSYEPSNLALPPVLMVEEQRTNILLKSSDMHLVPWFFAGAVSRATGKLAPDGTLRAVEVSGTPTGSLGQSAAATSTVMTFSVYLKNVSRNAPVSLQLRNTTTAAQFTFGYATLHGGSPSISGNGWEMRSVGGGWLRCAFTQSTGITVGDTLAIYPFHVGDGTDHGAFQIWGAQLETGAFATSYVPSVETFTGRASIGTYFDSTGAMKTAVVGAARMTYNPADPTIAPWLMQEAEGANLFTESEFRNGVSDAPTRNGVTATTVDWLGFTTGLAFQAPTGPYNYAVKAATLAASTTYVVSAFVKMDDGLPPVLGLGAGADLAMVIANGAVGTGATSVVHVGNGVYKVSGWATTGAAPAGGAGIYKYAANSARTFKVTGYQLEQASFASSYVPTTTAPVTRLADAATSVAATRQADTATSAATTRAGDNVRVDTSKGWCNATEGTIFMEFGRPLMGPAESRTLVEIGATSSNRLGIGFNPTGTAHAVSVTNGVVGPSTSTANLAGTPEGGTVKASISYGVDGVRFGCNGQPLRKVALAAVSPFAFLGIGNLCYGGNQPFFHVRALRYQPQKLTDAEVVALTA